MPIPLVFPLLLTAVPTQAEPVPRPAAADLVEEARSFVPSYEGDSKPFLSADEERDLRVASTLLDAALLLEAENAYAWWWKGQCETLLGENARNRERAAEGAEHDGAALAAFDRAIALDPSYYWAHYARGMALHHMDAFWEALESYGEAIVRADEAIADAPDEDAALDPRFVRFKARQWRADTRMRTLEHERAREEFRAFYADNGDNQWDLGYSLAETYLHERDLAGARGVYLRLLEDEAFVPFSSTYEQLGYLAGLLGDGPAAVDWLERSFEHELVPGLYPRLWLYLLAEGDARERARIDLLEFVGHPPSELSAWDRRLGAFVLGQESVADFLAAADEEAERRRSLGQPLDDLPCESWFYAGWRQAQDGRPGDALEAYRRALAFRPRQSKWELEYARLFFAQLAERLRLGAHPGFALTDEGLALEPDAPLLARVSTRQGALERVLRHAPGTAAPRAGGAELAAGPFLPGELLQCVLRTPDGRRHAVLLIVDAR